ncbi:MAG: pitrilysin family protein [Actinomycetota bacterium]
MTSIRIDRVGDGPLVLTDPVLGARSVALGVWVGVGSRDEPTERAGVCHFLEHLLFKGTPRRSALDLARSVERAGGELDAFTSREHTVLHGRFPARHTELAVDLLGEVLSEPAFRSADVDLEREVILDELAAAHDVPEDDAYVLLYETLFPDHGLGRDSLGTAESIERVGRDDIASFFADEFRADRMVVVGAGAVDHDELVERLDSVLRVGPANGELHRTAPTPRTGAIVERRRDCEQGHLLLAWPSPPAGDDRRHALAVLTQVLGGGAASRLFQRVREDRGWAYSVYATTAAFSDAGVLIVGAATAPGRLDGVAEITAAEIDDLRRHGPDADELATAIGYLAGSAELAAEDPAARMYGHGMSMLERFVPMDVDADVAALQAVTAADVAELADELFATDPTRVAVRPS